MSVFDRISTGLQEAIEYKKGNLPALSTKLFLLPLK